MTIVTSQCYGFGPEGCTVLSKGTEAVLAASVTNKQFAELADKPQPEQMSKNLQVSLPPMAITTSHPIHLEEMRTVSAGPSLRRQ